MLSQLENTATYLLEICRVRKVYPDSIVWSSTPISLYRDNEIGLPMMQIEDLVGSLHLFIVDTGAPYSIIPESEYFKFGITVLSESIWSYTAGGQARIGIAPRFKIGEIVIYNKFFWLIPDDREQLVTPEGEFLLSARIIGWDFLRQANNIQFTENDIIFNQLLDTPHLNNFLIDNVRGCLNF